MTFYERFVFLCSPRKPNPVASEIGVSSATVTKWKYGAIPDGKTIKAIAGYFGCTSDYLLGLSDTPTVAAAPTLTPVEAEMLKMFRNLPEFQRGIIYGETKAYYQQSAEKALQEEEA